VDRGRTSIANGTPGERFQSYVLANFHSIASFSPHTLLSTTFPGDLWVTPPFRSPCFTVMSVENLLNFFLCAPPERLVVTSVGENVFHTRFASRNVARFVAVCGSWHLGRFNLGFHSTIADARDAALKIQTKLPVVKTTCV
jgi:hypothetical protein